MASRASRGLNLRMQEVETKAPVEEVVDKALEVKKEGSAMLKRGTGTQVRTAPEVNFYARVWRPFTFNHTMLSPNRTVRGTIIVHVCPPPDDAPLLVKHRRLQSWVG